MAGLLRESLVRAGKISVVGITLGGIAAIASLLAAPNVQAVASLSAAVFWTLAVVPSAALLVMAMNDVQAEVFEWYRPAAAAYSLLLIANVVGAVVAMLFFYVLVSNAPVVLRGLEANALRQATTQAIGLSEPVVVLAAAVAGALGVAAWVRGQVTKDDFESRSRL